ncbi:MAG: hypothetical protein KVP17_004213 [Porospora cf. gigantea B]|uniref:uncharacterized protein n=1 Tax=Porospora cf. gigantea B TaxID=2853592 RepID=UPI003571D31C|nr:MAG: hypothetical protein KVP17_004213 [Porospora cf. gigantea B]
MIPLEEVPLRFVDTVEALQEMLNELKREVVIAVDLEHHSKHSYRGITCLIQISSPSVDYVVDPFPIWHSVYELNQVFTDPGIMKLFFGCANSDVLWLQRDFSVYIVNLFDVQEGIRTLQTPGGYSFGNAVGFYLSQTIGKEHQRSDWRQRPLPDDMITYARLDTRLLLPLFAHVKRQLLYRGSTELGVISSLGRNSIAVSSVDTRHADSL